MALHTFEKWAIYFFEPINPLRNKTGACYIITATDYIIGWAEAKTVKDCTIDNTVHFIFEHILTRFECPNILMSDRSMHFFNETIEALTEEFQIHHKKSTPYHPQENGVVEYFNNILENTLTNIYNSNQDYWDVHIASVLWAIGQPAKS